MTMDQEARALVEQLVAALAPMNHPAPSHALQETPDHEPVHGAGYTAGAARTATAAIVAGKAALAATSGA